VKFHEVFGVRIDDVSDAELEETLLFWLESGQGKVIVTTNAEFLLLARQSKIFHEQLHAADLSLPDSVSLRYAIAALTDSTLKNRHPGVDVLQDLARLSSQKNKRILLIGGSSGTAQATKMKFLQSHPDLQAAAIDPGHLSFDETISIASSLIEQIRQADPHVVAVALGQGKQEAFIFQLKDLLPRVRIWIGVGGAFDMLSGQKKRAPRFIQKMGLEWAWRLLKEPRRWRRIVNASLVFPFVVVLSTLKARRFWKALCRVFPEIYRQFRGV
jgi:N-acetylglucosaminyldiphosphoundecaprenol N-acetyl-beta-D-mannosaminyltransferase